MVYSLYLHLKVEDIDLKTRVQKWGNSLALRIPKSFATEIKLAQDTPVEVSVKDGTLVVAPLPSSRPTLEQLLEGVTEANRHGEVDFGPTVGKEVW